MKRLVCSMDGTWHDDEGSLPATNVAKLTRAVLPTDDRGVRQFVRYVVGIPASQKEGSASLRGSIISERIKAAYQFLSSTYEPGDEIYLFGFSRGAYEARSLASFIALFGLARKDADFSIDDAWRLYRKPERRRKFDAVAELSAACHYPVRIRCIGVWDTVDNSGNPRWPWPLLSRRLSYHDTRWHDTIDVALHALSIDETRGAFRPTMFTLPEGVALPSQQHVEQAWFAGTHVDVGGGWPETELSDITLLWMAEQIQSTTDLAIDIDGLKGETSPDPLGLQHVEASGWRQAFSRRFSYLRLIQQNVDGIPVRRRNLFRTWRTNKIEPGCASLNETISTSAHARLGQSIPEAYDGHVQERVYQPSTLVAAVSATSSDKKTQSSEDQAIALTTEETAA